MNIRRFTAQDMRDALRDIRSTLGPDAVMLSSRKTLDGVEVIAAMDYDDHLLAAVGDKPESATPAACMRSRSKIRISRRFGPRTRSRRRTRRSRARNQRAGAGPGARTRFGFCAAPTVRGKVLPIELSAEINDLRRLLEGQMATLAWNDLNRRAPGRARALRQLSRLGVDSALARELADQLPISTSRTGRVASPITKICRTPSARYARAR